MAAACQVARMTSKESGRSTEDARQVRLRQLIAEHFDSVWKFLRRIGVPEHLAEDVSQEVFLVASRRIDDIKVDPTSERSFLVGTAYRVSRDLVRKAHRETLQDVDTELAASPSPEEQLDEKRACEAIYRIFSGLDEDVRAVFVMYEMEGMTMNEIAQVLGLPIGTVGSRLRRAREDFKARFERHRKRLREAR
jgi:RNA polymerase sigma-70 factor (ECF subfamily)